MAVEAVRKIILEVCLKHKLSLAQIRSRTRIRGVSWPRQEVMYRAVNETGATFQAIAHELGLANHTSVIHGVEAHAKRISGGTSSAPDIHVNHKVPHIAC